MYDEEILLTIIYLAHKFPPQEGGVVAGLFIVLSVVVGIASLVALWLLITRWATLSVGERWRLAFYVLFI